MKPAQILRTLVLGALFAAGSAHASPPPGSDAWWGDQISAAASRPVPRFAPVQNREQLPSIIKALEAATARTMQVDRDAIASHASPEVRLLAAYQLGMTHLAIVVGARAAIVMPAEAGTDPEAANHWQSLHRALEPLLANHLREAVAAFQEARAISDEIPEGVPADAVVRGMMPVIRSMLETIEVS